MKNAHGRLRSVRGISSIQLATTYCMNTLTFKRNDTRKHICDVYRFDTQTNNFSAIYINISFFFSNRLIKLRSKNYGLGPKYNDREAFAKESADPLMARKMKTNRQNTKGDVGRKARESTSERTRKRSEGLFPVVIALTSV